MKNKSINIILFSFANIHFLDYAYGSWRRQVRRHVRYLIKETHYNIDFQKCFNKTDSSQMNAKTYATNVLQVDLNNVLDKIRQEKQIPDNQCLYLNKYKKTTEYFSNDDNMLLCGIYQIKNKITNKIYIGRTQKSFAYRWRNHKRDLQRGKHCNKLMQNDFGLYGIDSFEFTILEIIDFNATDEYVYQREMYFIARLDSINLNRGYNKSLGGDDKLMNKRKYLVKRQPRAMPLLDTRTGQVFISYQVLAKAIHMNPRRLYNMIYKKRHRKLNTRFKPISFELYNEISNKELTSISRDNLHNDGANSVQKTRASLSNEHFNIPDFGLDNGVQTEDGGVSADGMVTNVLRLSDYQSE